MPKDPHIYKHGYSFLFSDPVFVRELLESFVDKDFAASLDFSTFEVETEKHYITKDFTDYAEDLVIKLKYQGQEAYIYLLLEFQSTIDKFMALRMLNYIILPGLHQGPAKHGNPCHIASTGFPSCAV